MDFIMKIYKQYRNLILYGIIGSCTAGLDFLIYTFLTSVCDMHYILSNCTSVVAGIVASFILNRKYNFKVKNKVALRFTIFLSVGLSGMVVSNILLYLFVDVMSMNELISKLLSIIVVVIFQFLLNKYITFKTYK